MVFTLIFADAFSIFGSGAGRSSSHTEKVASPFMGA
jgi:hypothetical protein